MIRMTWEVARTWVTRADGPCAYWDGTEQAYCGEVEGVRRFVQGRRCPAHAPGGVW